MVTEKLTELRGSRFTLELPWEHFPVDPYGEITLNFVDMDGVNKHLRQLVNDGVFAWVLLPGSDGY